MRRATPFTPLPPRALRPTVLATALLLACAAPAVQAQASTLAAEAEARSFDIPAQPLGVTLARIATEGGQTISIDAALVRGRAAPAVQGRYTLQQAAQAALVGSELELVRMANGSWGLRAAPAGKPASGAGTASGSDVSLGEVRVTAQGERSLATEHTGSYTTHALSIGKMPQSIRETPQSVTVVTRQQMEDQHLVAVEDVIAQTTGTSKSQRNYGAHVYTMRGYEIPDSNYLLDGVGGASYSPTGWVPMDTAILDRVEVLRGAGALVVGAGDPSGVVNMVRKRPRSEKHLEVAQSIGSWSNYRSEIDAGGPLNEAGTVRGRVVAAYTDRKYFYDLAHSKAPMLYGVIDADLGDSTRLTVGYRHEQVGIDGYAIFGLPSYTTGASLGLPRSTSLGQRWNRHDAKVDEVFAELEKHFAGDWVGKLTLNRNKTTVTQKLGMARGAVDPATNLGAYFLGTEFTDRDIDASGLDAHVSGSFQAWGGVHKLMFGTSWKQQDVFTQSFTAGQRIPVDLFHFNHDLIPEPATPVYDFGLKERSSLLGIYASARLQLADPLHLHLGGRFNWFKFRSNDHFTGALTNDYRQSGQFTPYAGLVYDLGPQWSVYASYTSTFEPQSQYANFEGQQLKPAIGANYEAGIKGELMDSSLNVALSVFNIKKRNVAVYDRDHEGLCPGITTNDCYRNASLLRSKGFDAEIGGRIARGWDIAAGYTYLSTRNAEGQSLASDAPRHLLRLSTSYTLPDAWSDWKIGANLAAQSNAYVDTVQNPGHAVLDLRAAYRINRQWTASLNIANVTDRVYWTAIGGTRNGSYYGAPRNATLTLRGTF
ncbi:TonB-dependent siderophore receptor [Comamonas terrigena]|uniref:TonB-dependent siderophore receptor n=1 Tax=Comamonas terrigena TaxID=32013 RepID=UPI002447930E|nr:TonB-dependent receptor [Comamonas terrigena]MDH1704108.1 TonB-dependent receptor [Comamonas terrigena]